LPPCCAERNRLEKEAAMRSTSCLARWGLALALGIGGLAQGAIGQGANGQVPGPIPAAPSGAIATAQTLETLVAPVALYPDDLLVVVLQAATQPVQIVQAGRFLDKHAKDKSLQPNPGWSDPVKILVNYPDVLRKLNDDLDWTEQLGEAMQAQQGDVLAAVQQFRRRAAAAGNLRSDDKLAVAQDGASYVIESVNPQVIPVPVYDPAVVVVQQPAPVQPVYVPTPYPAYYAPAAAAATGFFFGALTTAWVMDWNRYGIDEDNISHYQQSRQQSLDQRQQSRQDSASQRQQARQDTSTQRQQTRQDSTTQRQQGRQDARGERQQPQPSPRQAGAQQDLGAVLSGQRPGQQPGQGAGQGAVQRPAQGPGSGGAYQPGQRPTQGLGAGGGMQPSQRPAQAGYQPAQRPGYDSGMRDRAGQMPAGGGAQAVQRPSAGGGSFNYGSGRSAVQASDRGAQSRSYSGGSRPSGARAGGGGGGRGGGGRR